MLVLVNFQDKLLQCKLLDYILIGIPRVAIWNVAAKQVTLLSVNSQIVRNRPATEPVTLKVHNVKLSFDIWLVLYMYFILYS